MFGGWMELRIKIPDKCNASVHVSMSERIKRIGNQKIAGLASTKWANIAIAKIAEDAINPILNAGIRDRRALPLIKPKPSGVACFTV